MPSPLSVSDLRTLLAAVCYRPFAASAGIPAKLEAMLAEATAVRDPFKAKVYVDGREAGPDSEPLKVAGPGDVERFDRAELTDEGWIV